MKKIKLTKGKFALIDDENYKWLNQWKWYCNCQGYAVREKHIGTKNKERIRKTIRMHRLINRTPRGFETDHIDRNGLNNQKNNLRTVTHAENMFNLRLAKNNISGHRGVNWHKETQKWRAYINMRGKQIYLGIYKNIEDAILARKQGEEKYYAI